MGLFLMVEIFVLMVQGDYIEEELDDIMTLGWEINQNDNEIEITLKCKISKGFCGLGLGSQMSKADIYLVTIDEDTIEVKDCYATTHSLPLEDSDQGGKTSIKVLSKIYSTSKSAIVKFSRKLNTGDSLDREIIPDNSQSIIWAHVDGKSGVSYHGNNRFQGKINFSSSSETYSSEDFSEDDTNSKKNGTRHGIRMTIAWGLLATIGIISARYFKAYPWWIIVHVLSFLATSILTIYSSSSAYKAEKSIYEYFDDDRVLHSRTGHFLAALVIGQTIFGIMGSCFKIFTRNTTVTLMLLKIHRFVGYVMFIVGLRNLYVGWDLNTKDRKEFMIIIYVIVPVLFVALEVYQKVFRNKISLPSEKLKEMNHFEVMDMVREGKKIMFADEFVVNVSHFYKSHPGGSFMINRTVGEDAGKYMVGCSSYGNSYNAYSHSEEAFSMLKSLAIGKISKIPEFLVPLKSQESIYMTFSVTQKKNLNHHTRMLYISSPDFKVSETCKEPQWLGKHFMFIFKRKFDWIKRYYSCIFTDFTESSDPLQETTERSSGMLKFVFKVYPDGKMTNYLESLNEGDQVMIRGPLGPGLLLQELSGTFLALAGGTGLVPFIDLVEMAYQKFGNTAEDFHLNMFVFFKSFQDGFALERLKELAENAKWLELLIVTDELPNKNDVRNIIKGLASSNFDLAWICGPSGFNRSYKKLLRKAGLPKDKIILM